MTTSIRPGYSRVAAERRKRRLAEMDAGLRAAVEAAGGIPQLADALGLNRSGVWRWNRVPPRRAPRIEELYGVRREILRPDIFG